MRDSTETWRIRPAGKFSRISAGRDSSSPTGGKVAPGDGPPAGGAALADAEALAEGAAPIAPSDGSPPPHPTTASRTTMTVPVRVQAP